MTAKPTDPGPSELLDAIPDEPTARAWAAETVRKLDLLRSLHKLARRKAALKPRDSGAEGGEPCEQ